VPGPGLNPNQPLGPPQVLTPPAAWLGLLNLKSGGVQPGSVNPSLSPTQEMTPFYRMGARQNLARNVALANANNANLLVGTVPQGKIWIVESAWAQSGVLGAAAGVNASFVAGAQSLGANYWGSGLNARAALTGETALAVWQGTLFMNPGDQISLLSTAAAAPTAFNWNVLVIGCEVNA